MRHALGREERRGLLHERVLRLLEDADEVGLGEGVELHADREAALELGHQVARLGHVERAGGDEEDVLRADDAVARRDRGALDEGQEVALHALAGDVGPARGAPAAGDLVDLVEEDDARLLDAADRLGGGALLVDELVGLLDGQELDRLGDADAPGAAAAPGRASRGGPPCRSREGRRDRPRRPRRWTPGRGARPPGSRSRGPTGPRRAGARAASRGSRSSRRRRARAPARPCRSRTGRGRDRVGRLPGRRASRTRSSAASRALTSTPVRDSARTIAREASTRSRTMLSTSRPT